MATGFPKTNDFWQISNEDYTFTIRREKFKKNAFFSLDDFLFSVKIDVKAKVLPKIFEILHDLDESLVSIITTLQNIYQSAPPNTPLSRRNNHLDRQIYITFQDADNESSFVSVNSGKHSLVTL